MIYKGFSVDEKGNIIEYFDNTPKLTVEIPYGHKPTGCEIEVTKSE